MQAMSFQCQQLGPEVCLPVYYEQLGKIYRCLGTDIEFITIAVYLVIMFC